MTNLLKDMPALFATERGIRLKELRDEIEYALSETMGDACERTSHYYDDKTAFMNVVFKKRRYKIEVTEV